MAIVVPVISTFDAKGINKAISNFKNLEGGAAKTGFVLRAMDQGMTSLVKNVAKAGAALGALGAVVGTKLVMAGYESQKVFAQTAQIIQNTGFAAGHTAESLSEMSEKLSEQIGVDDELIQKSANLLLTFRQIQNQGTANNAVFDRAVVAAQDLGNVFGSAEGAAMQLGKALADPERGITALRRSGINFTETQQTMIKNFMAQGNLLEAQKVILGEVERQVGGTAKATATDFERMKVAVGNLAEDLGRVLIPYVEKFARFIKDQVLPYIRNLMDIFGEEGLGGVMKKIGGDFIGFITNLEGTGAKVYWLITAMVALKAAVIGFTIATQIATVITKAFDVALKSNLIGLIVAGIIALTVALVAAYIKFEGFRKVVNTVINFVIGYFENMANFWIRAINLVIAGIKKLGPVLKFIGIDVSKLGPIAEVTFPRISNAAKKATTDINKFGNAVEEARFKAIGQRIGATGGDDDTGGGGGGESAIERAKRQFKEYTDALKKVSEAQKGLRDSSKQLADAQKNVTASAQAVRDAQDGLRKATDAVRLAELNLDKVRRGLGAGSTESRKAAERVEQAQRDLEEAGYGVEDAQFAVLDATQKLSELRTSTEAVALRDVREAEIALARAKLGLTERQIAQRVATSELSAAQTEYNEITNGATEETDRYKEAMKELTEAKEKQDEASKKVQDALENERQAIEKVTEAQNSLRDATWEVFDAEKALQELRSQIPKAIRQDARGDFAMREAGFAPGVTLPDVAGMVVLPDFVDVSGGASGTNIGGTNITINSSSLNPADAADYIVEALRAYERSNGFIPVRVDSAVYAI